MGGGIHIRYTLTDPVPGAELTLGYDRNQQWIEFDLTTPGVIAFTAKKNETADPRELAVEVNYPGIRRPPLSPSVKRQSKPRSSWLWKMS